MRRTRWVLLLGCLAATACTRGEDPAVVADAGDPSTVDSALTPGAGSSGEVVAPPPGVADVEPAAAPPSADSYTERFRLPADDGGLPPIDAASMFRAAPSDAPMFDSPTFDAPTSDAPTFDAPRFDAPAAPPADDDRTAPPPPVDLRSSFALPSATPEPATPAPIEPAPPAVPSEFAAPSAPAPSLTVEPPAVAPDVPPPPRFDLAPAPAAPALPPLPETPPGLPELPRTDVPRPDLSLPTPPDLGAPNGSEAPALPAPSAPPPAVEPAPAIEPAPAPAPLPADDADTEPNFVDPLSPERFFAKPAEAEAAPARPTEESDTGLRTWVDSTGRFRVYGRFLAVEGEDVVLARETFGTLRVPLERFSQADRELIERLRKLPPSERPALPRRDFERRPANLEL